MIASLASPFFNRYLLGQLIKRDVLLLYRSAMFGVPCTDKDQA